MRNWGFRATDLLRGSPIGKHCRDIEARLDAGTGPEDLLEPLLRFATEHTSFYADRRGFSALEDFPVIDKGIIKSRHEAFHSDTFEGQRLHVMHTSGSTGTPMAVLQDPDKRRRVLAEMICFGRRAGYQVGDRYVFTRVWTRENRKPWHVAFRENALMFDISSLDDPRMAELRRLLLTDRGIRCMLGYPSTLAPLIRHLDARGDTPDAFSLRTIISISERLSPELREALRSRFGCTVVARYSNQENGVLAQQCPDHDEFHLNTASYVFEYLKLHEDRPAAPEERARLVVTDLFNRAMPLIRYDTGDVVVRSSRAACGQGMQTLAEVEGRRMDFIYDTRDRLLSPVVVCHAFWPYTGLTQFQFIQTGQGRYRLVLNGADAREPDGAFIRLVRNLTGEDAQVEVLRMDQVPLLASGKFRSVVNQYQPPAETGARP
jgi:phenylacetate-CoA ligase